MRESEVQRAILLAVNARTDATLWRNNVGVDTARGVRYGLCPGSADLIGVCRGKFVALEVKSATGRASDAQNRFAKIVRDRGGIYAIVRSASEAMEVLDALCCV